jgi:hypothetical protein
MGDITKMNMFNKIICLFPIFLILSISIFSNAACVNCNEQSNNLIPIISVSGGMGINIKVIGATEDTSIIITLKDAMIRYTNRYDTAKDTINIYVAIIDFGAILFGNFLLYVSVGNDIYSYHCQSFLFVFAYNFEPID